MRCAVFGCNSDNQSKKNICEVKFFHFPKHEHLCKQWIHATRREDKFNVQTACVCSKHFVETDFKVNLQHKLLNYTPARYRGLNNEAVPTQNLPTTRITNSSNKYCAGIKKRERKQLVAELVNGDSMVFMCSIPGCKNTSKSAKIRVLPKDREVRKKWCQALGRNDLVDIEDNERHKFRVCDVHFVDDVKFAPLQKRSNIQLNSAPTLHLTEKDPLAIMTPDSLSLFGDSENIEFVIESGDESEECQILGTKDNPIVIQVTKMEHGKQLVIKEHLEKVPVIKDIHADIIDLDSSDADDIKEEIKIEDHVLLSEEDGNKGTGQESGVVVNNLNNEKIPNTKCYVPNCTIDKNEESSLHWFRAPLDKNARKLWDICIDRPDKILTPQDVICHQHFAESETVYGIDDNGTVLTKMLRDGAVPCIAFHEECCVPNCKNRDGYMYNFPVLQRSNFDLWLYMIKNMQLRKLKTKEVLRHRVCAVHFDSDCFEKNFVLKSTAAPTLFLPEYNMNQFGSELDKEQPVRQASTTRKIPNESRLCCAYGKCPNTNIMGKTLFKFPNVPYRCAAWLTACSREGLISTPEETVKRMASGKLGVCEDHFDQQCFESPGTLKPDAIPKTPVGITAESIRKSIAFSESDTSSSEAHFMNEQGTKIMPVSFNGICSYRSCTKKVSADNPFFSFPVDAVRCEQWLSACGLMLFTPLASRSQIMRNLRICSEHFEDDMFESKFKLKLDAIPGIFRKGRGENKDPNKLDFSNIIYCAVSTCPNNYGLSPGKGKFPDPTEDLERFKIWLRLVDNPALEDLSADEIHKKYMVCMKHFEPHFYMRDGKVGALSKKAVPTKFLTADIQWFLTSDYYKSILEKPMDNIETWPQKNNSVTVKQEKPRLRKGDHNTTCVLEEDGIRFPNTGHYIHVEKKPNWKRKFPYDVYRFFKGGYGLTDDITVGENVRIHTAIIIDDDDECERQVLQQLLDKRKRF